MREHQVVCSLFFLLVLFMQVSSVQLISLPEAWQGKEHPLCAFLNEAQEEVYMGTFKIHESVPPQQPIIQQMTDLVQRGVKVHLLAENKLTEIEKQNFGEKVDSLSIYKESGARIYSSQAENSQEQCHIKVFIVDGSKAMVGNTNFDKAPEGTPDRPGSRDFVAVVDQLDVVKELKEGFQSMIDNTPFEGKSKKLIWGPSKQREKLTSMIQNALHRIYIYQQDITDSSIVEAICSASQRGVDVQVIMSPHPFGTSKPDNNIPHQKRIAEAGGQVFLNQRLNIHAKVLIADNQMYIGSTNFYQPSIDSNKNVGLIIDDFDVIHQVIETFESDKKKPLIHTLKALAVFSSVLNDQNP